MSQIFRVSFLPKLNKINALRQKTCIFTPFSVLIFAVWIGFHAVLLLKTCHFSHQTGTKKPPVETGGLLPISILEQRLLVFIDRFNIVVNQRIEHNTFAH